MATSRNTWGPPRWDWLHCDAISYPDTPTREQAAAARRRFGEFVATLPCGTCRRHVAGFARRSPPDLRSSAAYQRWTFSFHNTVNARIQKHVMSIEDYHLVYADELAWAPLIQGRYPSVPAPWLGSPPGVRACCGARCGSLANRAHTAPQGTPRRIA